MITPRQPLGEAPAHAVEIDGVRLDLGGRRVLEIERLVIPAGQRVALIGANGAGKSSLLRSLNGLVTPQAGRVRVLGHTVCDGGVALAGPALRALRAEVAPVMQGLHLVARLSALDNVLIGALGRRHAWVDGWRSLLRWPSAEDVARAQALLAQLGLAALAHQRADRLSGGQRQKVAIARARMQRLRLLLADEPTASLDPAAAQEACDQLMQVRAHDPRVTVISVVHSPALLPRLADRVIGLRDGRIAFDRPLAQLDLAQLGGWYDAAPTPPTAAAAPLHNRTSC
ncbi:MAG: phosphonate ABC transporter ATP-binding protein [Leptothrix sp. (in: b-proteobacteria)]